MTTYSFIDQMVHRFAFSSTKVQLAAADIEDSLFARDYEQARVDRPIFITSLPRAGTTILLTALHSMPMLATHLYRDMPFVMAPLLWSRMSSAFQRAGQQQERAHGDGIQISYDSPEAFEEVFWRTFWPEKYASTKIDLWDEEDANPEAEAFFRRHIRKIISLRCGADASDGRYISKNNCNIARLALIPRMFPDARILVPVRMPLAHASSLLRQHLNFLQMHKSDSFVRRYMEDIGHLEFGALHLPIGFVGFEALAQGLDPIRIDYWLAYWIAAFEHVQAHREAVLAVSYEQVSAGGTEPISSICDKIGLEPGPQLDSIAAHFRPSKVIEAPRVESKALLDRARALYEELVKP